MTTEALAKLLDSVAHLLSAVIWPVLLVAFVYYFYEPLKKFIASLSELSFKAPGIEWTAKAKTEAAAALGAAIGKQKDEHPDTIVQQTQLASRLVNSLTPNVVQEARNALVLWVDDQPSNNVNERRALEAFGVTFVLSTSTEDALAQMARQNFQLIISDMGRPEDSKAGLTLLETLRNSGNKTPYIIYASSRALAFREEAMHNGALEVINRPDKLFELVVSTLAKLS